MTIWNSKVSENIRLTLEGKNRTCGGTICRTVGELLAEAEDAGGVYGPENKPASGDMSVRDLADWHADYVWRVAEGSEAENQKTPQMTEAQARMFLYELRNCDLMTGSWLHEEMMKRGEDRNPRSLINNWNCWNVKVETFLGWLEEASS